MRPEELESLTLRVVVTLMIFQTDKNSLSMARSIGRKNPSRGQILCHLLESFNIKEVYTVFLTVPLQIYFSMIREYVSDK